MKWRVVATEFFLLFSPSIPSLSLIAPPAVAPPKKAGAGASCPSLRRTNSADRKSKPWTCWPKHRKGLSYGSKPKTRTNAKNGQPKSGKVIQSGLNLPEGFENKILQPVSD